MCPLQSPKQLSVACHNSSWLSNEGYGGLQPEGMYCNWNVSFVLLVGIPPAPFSGWVVLSLSVLLAGRMTE